MGYVSSDFREHPVGYIMLHTLAHHIRARVEVRVSPQRSLIYYIFIGHILNTQPMFDGEASEGRID